MWGCSEVFVYPGFHYLCYTNKEKQRKKTEKRKKEKAKEAEHGERAQPQLSDINRVL